MIAHIITGLSGSGKTTKCYFIDNLYNIDLLKNNIDNYLDSLWKIIAVSAISL